MWGGCVWNICCEGGFVCCCGERGIMKWWFGIDWVWERGVINDGWGGMEYNFVGIKDGWGLDC